MSKDYNNQPKMLNLVVLNNIYIDASIATAKELEEILSNLRNSFSDRIDYLKMLLTAFEGVRSPDNAHLNNFYMILPPLVINFIEKMLIAKD